MKTLQSLEQLDAIVYTLVNHTSFDVSEDKEFEYKTYKKDNMLCVYTSFIEAYSEPNFKGDYLQPADEYGIIRNEQIHYYLAGDLILKIIKDMEAELERIMDADEPELIEEDADDYVEYEKE